MDINGTVSCTCATGFTGPSCGVGEMSIHIYEDVDT